MQIDCLKITFESEEVVTCKSTQQIDDAEVVGEMKNNEQSVVYLFVNEHLDELSKYVDVVLDRGVKEARKELMRHLVLKKNLDKIPLLRTDYNTVGKTMRGIKVLFQKIEQQEIIDSFILGVKKEVFDDFWNNTEEEEVKSFLIPTSKPVCKTPGDVLLDSTEHRIFRHLEGLHGVSPELEREFVGNSESAHLIRVLILAAARSECPVLILGDTGTGKEVVSRAIHDHSSRKNEAFVPVNCGSIPSELLEYELFGGEKNITHSGQSLKIGLWESVGKGTLFLDEIGDLRPDHQVKILRALENNTIRRVGGTQEIKVHARILAATNRNLFSMVQSGKFREDLFYRLRGFFIRLAPLKNHMSDVAILANFFWNKITGNPRAKLSADLLEELLKYSWPGNVRELKMVLTNLYSLFKREDPSVTYLKDTFYLEGLAFLSPGGVPTAGDEARRQRVRCLQHLKRADEVIHFCQYKFKGSLAEDIKNGEPLPAIRESLLFLNHEIEMLCNKPTLFNQKKIFSAVYDFKGNISYLLSLLSQDRESAIEFLQTDIISSFDGLLRMISREIETIMSDG